MSPRASISTLARHFEFDAIETEGVIRFVIRGHASVATLAVDDLVASREGDALELTRGQETELPQALKWQVARADEDYDAALVEARRITVDTTRIASESFPMTFRQKRPNAPAPAKSQSSAARPQTGSTS
ncbi:phage tail protein [Roseibium sp.]|uniref:phage tail protein n=1 Tax=Roseibium sp. TaxID=1936156 RepID=UPI003A98286C